MLVEQKEEILIIKKMKIYWMKDFRYKIQRQIRFSSG